MNRADRSEEIRRFDPGVPLPHAHTPPSSWYTDPAILELEKRRVFGRTWQPVARLDQLAHAGDYVAGDLLDEPWLVVRGTDGELRAFANVCAHHATVLLTGAGHCTEVRCPYHGWTYGLDGRLVRAPGVGGMQEFEREHFGLAPLPIAVWGELVFVCASPQDSAPDTTALVEPGDPWMSPAGRLRFVARREYTIRCNWKVVVDNYLDGGYHVATLHPGLAGSLDLGSYTTHVQERTVVQRVRSDSATADRRVGEGALYGWVYPTWMLNRYGPVLDMNWVLPLDTASSRVVFDFWIAPDRAEDAEFVRDSLEASDRIQREDSEICERVQRGLASSRYDRGRYAPRFEAGAHRFHCLLAEQLADSSP